MAKQIFRKRKATRKYNCACGCGREIGRGSEYYQVGESYPSGVVRERYGIYHLKCAEKNRVGA